MNLLTKMTLLIVLSLFFCLSADLESETAKTFAFAAFMLSTTIVVCSGKKTGNEHQRSKAR